MYEIPVSLLTDFQEVENQDIENLDLENRERNNNYNTNKLNITNNYVMSSQSRADRCGSEKDKNDMTDVQAYEIIIKKNDMTDVQAYEIIIKKNIAYDDLMLSYPLDHALIDELVNIMLDTILSKGDYIHIGREEKPRTLVSSVLLKLGYNNVEYVFKKSMLISCLCYTIQPWRQMHITQIQFKQILWKEKIMDKELDSDRIKIKKSPLLYH